MVVEKPKQAKPAKPVKLLRRPIVIKTAEINTEPTKVLINNIVKVYVLTPKRLIYAFSCGFRK